MQALYCTSSISAACLMLPSDETTSLTSSANHHNLVVQVATPRRSPPNRVETSIKSSQARPSTRLPPPKLELATTSFAIKHKAFVPSVLLFLSFLFLLFAQDATTITTLRQSDSTRYTRTHSFQRSSSCTTATSSPLRPPSAPCPPPSRA